MKPHASALVLCALLVAGAGCSPDDRSATSTAGEGAPLDRSAPGSPATASPPAPATEPDTRHTGTEPAATGTPPPLNNVEAQIVEALGALGLHAERAELPGPDGASIWIPGPEPEQLHVVAYAASSARGTYEVVAEQEIGGVAVRTVEFASGIEQTLFDCDRTTYAVGGEAPAGFDGLHGFMAAFIEALQCDR